MNEGVTFDKITIGRRFKNTANIIYRKVSKVSAIVLVDRDGKSITNGKKTSLFYKSNVLLFEIV